MAELSTKKREGLRSSQFAYVDKKGGEHLPINDESHVRNAMARWNQTAFESMAAKERARKKIVSAAKRHGIEVDKEHKISKPVTSLRAASTKRGPRGGRGTHDLCRPRTPRSPTGRPSPPWPCARWYRAPR